MENSPVFSFYQSSFYFYISIHLLFYADSSQKLDCSYSARQCMKLKLLTSRHQTTSSSFPARSAPAWRDRNVSAVLRVCALARRMGKRRFELPPARRLVFLNVLVTVQTEMFDWVWTETRHSNATWELTRLPCETKQTVTFLNSAVVPLQLEHSHFIKTFIILGSVSEFGWQIMLPSSV